MFEAEQLVELVGGNLGLVALPVSEWTSRRHVLERDRLDGTTRRQHRLLRAGHADLELLHGRRLRRPSGIPRSACADRSSQILADGAAAACAKAAAGMRASVIDSASRALPGSMGKPPAAIIHSGSRLFDQRKGDDRRSGRHRDVLPAVERVGHRRGFPHGVGLEVPEPGAGHGIDRGQRAAVVAEQRSGRQRWPARRPRRCPCRSAAPPIAPRRFRCRSREGPSAAPPPRRCAWIPL